MIAAPLKGEVLPPPFLSGDVFPALNGEEESTTALGGDLRGEVLITFGGDRDLVLRGEVFFAGEYSLCDDKAS